MKPLADIIRAGFAFYSPDYSNPVKDRHSRYLCLAIGEAYRHGYITIGERDAAHDAISLRLSPHKTLRNYLRYELGIRFPTPDDSFAYWNKWLNELEGNSHE